MRCNDKGQVLISAAVAMVVLLGFLALGIDMGILRYEKRLQQTAADAAAIAGANEIRYSGGSGIQLAAQDASAANGFANGGSVTVTANRPPSSGPHGCSGGSCNSNYVEAVVSVAQPTFFARIFGINQAQVTARAVATLVSQAGNPAPSCIYTLDPNGGITFSGGVSLNAPTCGISDNGGCTINGSSGTISVGTLGVAGANGCGSQGVKQAPVPDPLSYLTPPTSGTNLGTMHINNGQVVSFAPGTYIFQNLTVNGGATVCNSVNPDCSGMPGSANTGVTFYVKGSLNINGGATVELSAPTSGEYAGILFYQDPNDTNTASLSGNSSSYYQGALYFPGAELDFGGTSFTNSTAAYTAIVSGSLKLNGNPVLDVQSNYSQLPGGTFPTENAVLVE